MQAPELIGGPYVAPRCRPGDWLDDEIDGRLEVGGWTDAPIPWPRRKKTGRAALILTGELARAVGNALHPWRAARRWLRQNAASQCTPQLRPHCAPLLKRPSRWAGGSGRMNGCSKQNAMTANDLREWQARHGYTYDTAAVALGVSRRTYAGYLARGEELPRLLELACAAVDAGLDVPQGDRKPS